MALQLPTGVETAADLELTDRRLYFYGGCRISQVDLRDVGLVGIGKLPERSGLEVLVAGEEQELETDEATAEACRQLGLPVAFASSGQVQMTSQNTSLQSPLSAGWQQAWDHSWSCWYYYNEALQVTQWEPPDAPIQPYTSELPLSPGITQHTLPSQDAHSPGGNAAAGAARKALPRRLARFWFQRYSLWSRFDDGILMDEAGWFSVTPEVLAAHHAHQCSSIFVDGFAGVGGNAIQAALAGFQVVAVDMDAARLELVAHNALLYGVQHCIELLCADFFEVAPRLQADVVFLSPPWGGLAYRDKTCFHVQEEFGGLGMGLSCLLTVATQALPTRTVYEDPTAALQSKMQSKSSTGMQTSLLECHQVGLLD
ncbi:hypothetical protein WJX84_011784 [Apatococcus fuscideae]|uniref:Trimethylguanosine synthase n=1 Tax=Apatococcus fuscideae TaxID=2026836 RepID=A0AAW1SVT4_9CHLO